MGYATESYQAQRIAKLEKEAKILRKENKRLRLQNVQIRKLLYEAAEQIIDCG